MPSIEGRLDVAPSVDAASRRASWCKLTSMRRDLPQLIREPLAPRYRRRLDQEQLTRASAQV